MTTISGKARARDRRAPKASTAQRQAKFESLVRDKDLTDEEYWSLH